MKSIALTGATGMIGLALIQECINNNVAVSAFVRTGSKKIDRLPKSNLITVFECDLENLRSFQIPKNFIPADVFYHIGWSHTDKAGRLDCGKQLENVEYTLDSVYLAQKLGCGCFIGAGSQAEYGMANTTLDSKTPVNPFTAYGTAKYAAGKLSFLECAKIGMRHIWVRILSVYGKNDNDGTLITELLRNCREARPMQLSACTQNWDFLHEADAARAFFLLGQANVSSKTYCLASGKSKPLKKYVERLVSLVNSSYCPQYAVEPQKDLSVLSLSADISELTADTGWKPEISFEQGIRLINESYKETDL